MRLLFVDGTKGFAPGRVKEKATGGILNSLGVIPKKLAAMGHAVTVKSTFTESKVIDGVTYLGLLEEVQKSDVVIFNRNVISNELIDQAHASGAKVAWWLHDIVDHRYLRDDAFKRVDLIISLSDYCTSTYSAYYEIDRAKFVKIPNGVNKDLFYPGKHSKRNKNLFVYASAPIKGVKPLGFTATNLKRHNPDAELRMYASQGLHDQQDDALVRYQLQQMTNQGATVLPPVSQAELADVFREAWALLMPNSYPEICSNVLLQARACGLPVVASPTGSIPEFLENRKTGLITNSSPLDLYFWWAEFARLTVELSQSAALHQRLSEEAPKGVLSWDEVASMWHLALSQLAPKAVAV
jgi:glycosyltransferase involved in cell wall biosynthesis